MVEAPDFQFGMWEVEDALARVDMHEQYEVDYNEFLDRAVGEDHFLTGWKTEFLRPRHIRGKFAYTRSPLFPCFSFVGFVYVYIYVYIYVSIYIFSLYFHSLSPLSHTFIHLCVHWIC
uniref:Uncharacterized protein n=2 Tax=Palpitomonas bilix TaxID=652834 RepID=A0A7S3GFU7_9EUKA|mmetsp:Transcript_47412/g.122654  ORF Transcript_47412/g.122654 Transcript_47412/m.122654 type:complete len:118 (+) Transcript_47412:150-503(+)